MKVLIRRQWNDHRIGEVELDDLDDLRWDTVSGGVRTRAPQPFIHGYVSCEKVHGEISHSGIHGNCPHYIKVTVVKKGNCRDVWNELLILAGPKPEAIRKMRSPKGGG